MYGIRQKLDGQIEIDLRDQKLEDLIKSYLEDQTDLSPKSRVYLYLARDEGERRLKISRAISPIFEIALNQHKNGELFLKTHMEKGFEVDREGAYFIFSLGDYSNKDYLVNAIRLYYGLIYNKDSFSELEEIFAQIKEEIIEGGYRSASYNGLQGYYFSRYFVKWLLDFKDIYLYYKLGKEEDLYPLFGLIENLQLPSDMA